MPSISRSGNASIKLIAIDDDPHFLQFVSGALAELDVDVKTATDSAEGLELVREERPHIVLLDLRMPDCSGPELLETVLEFDPAIDVILLTGHYSPESAVEAVQKGAADYLTKPIALETLRQRVGQFIDEARARRHTLQLDRELLSAFQFEGIVGRGPLMLDVFDRIRHVAPHFRTVLVTGETGTGKEMVARSLHRLSPVASGPFVVCNCSAIVDTLFESEMFGHMRGAFTGAVQDKKGYFESADSGTLFLDEIGDMSLGAQVKLLRVLQDQTIQRVGSSSVRQVKVRVIAATNRDLRALVAEKKFRDDLYYRLSAIEIKIPRLADRKEDLPLLQRYFLERFAEQYDKPIRGITRRAQAILARHGWPGNVRQLENVLSSACMTALGDVIDVRDLPQELQAPENLATDTCGEWLTLEEVKRRHIDRVLRSVGGNRTKAAEILGVSRATLYRREKNDPEQNAMAKTITK